MQVPLFGYGKNADCGIFCARFLFCCALPCSAFGFLPKADFLMPEVSAASIIAKVARDNYMTEVIAKKYPEYGFEKHVGYGTALHKAAIEKYGVCPEHRRSFKPIAKALGIDAHENSNSTKVRGDKGE